MDLTPKPIGTIEWEWYKLANKCPKTLENTGLSGILCFDENGAATLLQHAMEKARKWMVASGYLVKFGGEKYDR